MLVVVKDAIVIGENGQFDNAYDNKLTKMVVCSMRASHGV
jgi:hypothetical protein